MRVQLIALIVLALHSLPGCGGACGDPSQIEVLGDVDGPITIQWKESNAMGLYFTQPEARLPGGPSDLVEGYSYWVVEATKFPGGFSSPVTYGTIPKSAKDATEEHGGIPGGEPLECGVVYKVAVVALRGDAETFVEWDCDL